MQHKEEDVTHGRERFPHSKDAKCGCTVSLAPKPEGGHTAANVTLGWSQV